MRIDTRATTADYLQLDIRKLDRRLFDPPTAGRLTWTDSNGEQRGRIAIACKARDTVWLVYTTTEQFTGESTEHNYPARLDWTACNFGGERPWWLCPGEGCGRRCAILYGGAVFVCRECRNLAYPSQNESNPMEKARRKLRTIAGKMELRDQLHTPPEDTPPFALEKPKGMHWSTWGPLFDEWMRWRSRAVEARAGYLRWAANRFGGENFPVSELPDWS